MLKDIFNGEAMSVWELWQMHKKKRELRKEYLDHWKSTISQTKTGRPVDAIISPTLVALPHGKNTSVYQQDDPDSDLLMFLCSNSFTFYTSLWNALDYTVGVVPVTIVDPVLDRPAPPHDFYNDKDRELYNLCNSTGIRYDLQLLTIF